ncbi:MAG: hypothetical protein JHD16_04705 [Solirubrobacteraceae bacterium]|nr:hypothetical protein [Solirubrobacteraceae bacterium]
MSRRTQAARVASRSYSPEQLEVPGTPRLLRLVMITLVAVACLLAATLTGPVDEAGSAPAATVKTKVDGVTATLTYAQRKAGGSLRRYTKLRLTVRAAGRTTLKSVKLRGEAVESFGSRPRVSVAEVTGDGLPDVVVQVYTGGAHCCVVSAIAPSTAEGWGPLIVRNWADFGFELKDLGGTEQVEFKAWDARFTGAFGPFVASQTPIQVMRLQGGTFVDVTREFPEWIKQDITDNAKAWQDAATEDDAELRGVAGRSAAGAWIANLLQLGDTAGAKAVVEASAARGDFTGDGATFPGQLGHNLKVWGYLTDPVVIGLTDTPAAPIA